MWSIRWWSRFHKNKSFDSITLWWLGDRDQLTSKNWAPVLGENREDWEALRVDLPDPRGPEDPLCKLSLWVEMIPILCSPNNPIDTCCKCCIVTRQDLCQKPNKSFARSLQWMDMLQKKPAAVWNSVGVWSNWECWVTYKWSVSGSTVSVII